MFSLARFPPPLDIAPLNLSPSAAVGAHHRVSPSQHHDCQSNQRFCIVAAVAEPRPRRPHPAAPPRPRSKPQQLSLPLLLFPFIYIRPGRHHSPSVQSIPLQRHQRLPNILRTGLPQRGGRRWSLRALARRRARARRQQPLPDFWQRRLERGRRKVRGRRGRGLVLGPLKNFLCGGEQACYGRQINNQIENMGFIKLAIKPTVCFFSFSPSSTTPNFVFLNKPIYTNSTRRVISKRDLPCPPPPPPA